MAELTPGAAEDARRNQSISALAALIVVSTVARAIVAWKHGVPRLFPDEYIYTAFGRSLAHGHLAVRGGILWFPGILEPVAAAPIWRLASPPLAYHLVQVENAVFASLAAIPLYALARQLRLSRGWALATAAYGLLLPELVLVAFISSDALGYTLALSAIAVGVSALDGRSRAAQWWFVALSTLAALTRVEYVAIAPAYLAAAAIIERRQILRHRTALISIVPAAAIALTGSFGYYLNDSTGRTVRASDYVTWFFAQSYLAALALGVAIVPGAIAGLTKTGSRRERGFALFASAFALMVLVESTKFAAAKLEFKERYLFVLFALFPIAFGLYLRNGRPRKWLVGLVAAVIVIAAARVPISGYAEATFKLDSQSLTAVSTLYEHFSVATVALVVSLLATLAAILASALAFRGPGALAVVVAAAAAGTATVAAAHNDISTTASGRKRLLPADLRWVDHAARGPVTAVQTPGTTSESLTYTLYFNTSITRELLLDGALPTDAFKTSKLVIGRDGSLGGLTGDILFNDFGTTSVVQDARRVARAMQFTLWRTERPARLRLLVVGRYWTGWLSPVGQLQAWPTQSHSGVTVSFRLSLPAGWPRPSRVQLGRATFVVRPGQATDVRCDSGTGPLNVLFAASRTALDSDNRSLSVLATRVAVHDHASRTARRPLCTREAPSA